MSIVNLQNARDVSFLKQLFPEMFSYDDFLFWDDLLMPIADIQDVIAIEGLPLTRALVSLNFSYNVFLSAIVDTIQICSKDANGQLHEIISYNIEDNLDAQEKQIIDYFRGFIKACDNRVKASNNERPDQEALISNIQNLKEDFFRSPNERFINSNIESIFAKFPLLKKVNGRAFMYSTEIYVRDAGRSTNLVPFSEDYRDILEYENGYNDVVDNPAALSDSFFRKKCFDLIKDGIDPIQSFNNLNCIFSNRNFNKNSKLLEEEKILIANFINENVSMNSRDHNDVVESGVVTEIGYHNYKKVSKQIFLPQDHFFEQDIWINLVSKKNRGNINKIIGTSSGTVSLIDSIEDSVNNYLPPKRRDCGELPLEFREKNTFFFESIIKRTARALRWVHADRGVSNLSKPSLQYNAIQDQNEGDARRSFNSVYSCQTINNLQGAALSSRREVEATGDYMISRIFIKDASTLETYTHSKIIKNNLFSKLKGEDFVECEESLRSVSAYGFSIFSHEDQDIAGSAHPRNIVKICDVPSDIRVSRVVFSNGLNASVELPVFDENNEYIHFDPVPGEDYEYHIYLEELNSGILSKIPQLKVKIRTLNIFNSKLSLSRPQGPFSNIENYPNSDVYRVSISNDDLTSYKTNRVNSMLDEMFPVNENDQQYSRGQYSDVFENLISGDNSIVGNSFEILVNKINKRTGEYTGHEFIAAELNNDEDTRYFDITIPSSTKDSYIITYNLVVNNPFHDETVLGYEFEEIPEGNDQNRTRYYRKTSKFFNTITLNSVLLPSDVEGAYVFNSKISPTSKFNRVTCVGGYFEHEPPPQPGGFSFNYARVRSDRVGGTFLVEWLIDRPISYLTNSVDFFVITATLHNFGSTIVEFPIGAHPYIVDQDYMPIDCQFRTESFIGLASEVEFKVYIITNDFMISDVYSSTGRIQVGTLEHVNHWREVR